MPTDKEIDKAAIEAILNFTPDIEKRIPKSKHIDEWNIDVKEPHGGRE